MKHIHLLKDHFYFPTKCQKTWFLQTWLARLPSPIRKLSGLISLWRKLFECTYSTLLICMQNGKWFDHEMWNLQFLLQNYLNIFLQEAKMREGKINHFKQRRKKIKSSIADDLWASSTMSHWKDNMLLLHSHKHKRQQSSYGRCHETKNFSKTYFK